MIFVATTYSRALRGIILMRSANVSAKSFEIEASMRVAFSLMYMSWISLCSARGRVYAVAVRG